MEKCSEMRKQQVYVYDIDLLLTIQILEDTPAVLSLGKLCEDHGYSYEWTSGQKKNILLKNKKKNDRKYNATLRISAHRCSRIINWTTSSTTSTSSTSLPQDLTSADFTTSPASRRSQSTRNRALGDQMQDSTENENKNKNEDTGRARRTPLHDLPEWLKEVTGHSVDEEASASSEAPASIPREPLHQEPSTNVVSGKHSILYSLPEVPKLRSLQKDQNYKGSLQKSSTSSRKCW